MDFVVGARIMPLRTRSSWYFPWCRHDSSSLHRRRTILWQTYLCRNVWSSDYKRFRMQARKWADRLIHSLYKCTKLNTSRKLLRNLTLKIINRIPHPWTSWPLRISTASNYLIRLYLQLVGTLQYIVACSRLDISSAVRFLSRQVRNPAGADLRRVKRCLAYLRDTNELAIAFAPISKPLILVIFVDSSFASRKDCRSFYNFIIFLNDNILH